jgi:hypothetical protein
MSVVANVNITWIDGDEIRKRGAGGGRRHLQIFVNFINTHTEYFARLDACRIEKYNFDILIFCHFVQLLQNTRNRVQIRQIERHGRDFGIWSRATDGWGVGLGKALGVACKKDDVG